MTLWDHTDSAKQNQIKFHVKTKTVRIFWNEDNRFHLENKVKLYDCCPKLEVTLKNSHGDQKILDLALLLKMACTQKSLSEVFGII